MPKHLYFLLLSRKKKKLATVADKNIFSYCFFPLTTVHQPEHALCSKLLLSGHDWYSTVQQ